MESKEMFWKDVRNIGLMLLAIAGFVGISYLPYEYKHIFAIVFMIVFGLLLVMYTPIGNPLKAMYRKYQEKKNGKV